MCSRDVVGYLGYRGCSVHFRVFALLNDMSCIDQWCTQRACCLVTNAIWRRYALAAGNFTLFACASYTTLESFQPGQLGWHCLFSVRNTQCGVWACEPVEMSVSHGQCVRLENPALCVGLGDISNMYDVSLYFLKRYGMRQYRLYRYSSLIWAHLKNSGGCSVSCCSESS